MGKGDGSNICAPGVAPTKRRGQAREDALANKRMEIEEISKGYMEGMSESDRVIYALRQRTDPYLADEMDLEQSVGLSLRYPDAEKESSAFGRRFPDGYFLVEDSPITDERGLIRETQDASWKISLPGGLEAEITLSETPSGPMKDGILLWTSGNIEDVKEALESVLERLVEETDQYDDDPTQSSLRHAEGTLARILAHHYGCSEEEALAEIRRVQEEFYESATDIDLEERKKRCQELCENLASEYADQEDIDALGGEEILDKILEERADMSDKSFAEYIVKNHLSDSFSPTAVYMQEEIQNYRNGEYGDEKRSLSETEIVKEILSGDNEEEEWRKDWKEEKIQEVFSELENDETLVEIFKKHDVYEAHEGDDLGRLARESGSDFLEFFNEHSRYPASISYGVKELARDMRVEIEGNANSESDFIFSEGKLKELEPLDDECMREDASFIY